MRIVWYRRASGSVPMEEYLDAIDKKLRSKTLRTIQLLKLYGPHIGEPDSKPLGDGLFELRTSVGSAAGRVLYFFVVGDTAVLTHGFLKKTQKTPRREIERAERYRADFLSRSNREVDDGQSER